MKQLTRLLLIAASAIPTSAFADDDPALIWEYPTGRHMPMAVAVDSADSDVLFIAAKSGGILVLNERQGGPPQQLANVAIKQLGDMDAMNVHLRGQRLYVALGDFFKKASFSGAAVIDVSQPNRPKVLSVWKSKTPQKGGAAIVADDRRVYLGCMHFGVQVLSQRKNGRLEFESTFVPDPNFPTRNPGPIQRPNARGLALRGDRLFVAYDAGGLRVLDVSGDQPREIGRYINQAMIGKQQAYNNVLLDGARAYVAIDYAGLEVLDVATPRKIRQMGWWNPWRANTFSNLWFNSPGHTNEIAFDAKRKQILLSAGDSELQLVDVRMSASPQLSTNYGQPKSGQAAWGVTLSGDTAYLSYIKAVIPFRGTWNGVRAVRRN